MFTFEPKGIRDGAVPSVVGDEWKLASERRSIQPRVPLKAGGNLSRGECRKQVRSDRFGDSRNIEGKPV